MGVMGAIPVGMQFLWEQIPVGAKRARDEAFEFNIEVEW